MRAGLAKQPQNHPPLRPNKPTLQTELKEDAKGRQEFERYRARLEAQRADALARAERNRQWVAGFERQEGADGGAFEAQYARLCGEIEAIYEGAKEFHAHG